MADDDVIVQDEPAGKEPEPVQTEDKKKSNVREYQPPIPYPARLKQEKMPKYARFLKEILCNKRKLEDWGLVTLNEECSAILQKKLPVKRRDLGSSTVPCIIGDLLISDALANLGASINLMPNNLFEKLGLTEPKPTRMSIQLVDRTVKYPREIVEDILVKGENGVPLILGKPFLATSRVVIDVCDGNLQLRVGDETITFDLNTSMRHSIDHDDTVYSVDVLDDTVESQLKEILLDDPLKVHCPFDRSGVQKLRPSLEEPPALELKQLPKHLTYAYLDQAEKLPVIIIANLTLEKREMTLASLKKAQ
ncbi:uncharacterized protein LOC125369553 [Ricinus communis]|uniref:uncharacterized protein LOC125369553 n=1 Tax=Ricinus communis TaxID=3988 RepID=UPI00201A6CB4|nr:uncharacterized protein LOC125369553 [Ricinus communis]